MCEKKSVDRKKETNTVENNTLVNMLQWLIFIFFVIISFVLFIYLNRVQPYYFIDEVFHIPQTLRFCEGKFHEVSTIHNCKYFILKI